MLGAQSEREGTSMGDKNPKQKSRQDAQKQNDKNAKAAKAHAGTPTPAAPPKGGKKA
jgi:hypothetical protein